MTDSAPVLPHILVVDDSGGVRRTVERLLSPFVRVSLAESVSEALTKLTPCVQLVLSDVLMPEESGLDLAAYLRKTHPELPVVLFTGVVDAETRSRARAVGVEQVLRKPLLQDQLLKVIREWVGEGLPNHPAPSSEGLNVERGAAVLASPQEAMSRPEVIQTEAELVAPPPEVDPLSDLCRTPGVLSAAVLSDSGEVERHWNLPLPRDFPGEVVGVLHGLLGCADLLGSGWPEGQFMQLPLADRSVLLGRVKGKGMVFVVRDSGVAGQVATALRQLVSS